jgi:hypothetical protein
MIETLPRFPCREDKTPLTRWTNGARADVDDSEWPLVGVPNGAVSGFDALDIDREGLNWLASVIERLPKTRVHETRSGGRHLFWRHAEGLRCSAGRIAKGVDVRADGGYVIWWPRQGLRVFEAEIADWPDWLLGKAQKSLGPWQSDGGIVGLTHGPNNIGAIPGIGAQSGTLNFRARCNSIIRKVEHTKPGRRNELLNWGAYQFGQMVAEGLIRPDIAALLLEGGAKSCGLWHDDGPAQCRATIKSGIAAGIRDARERIDGGGSNNE